MNKFLQIDGIAFNTAHIMYVRFYHGSTGDQRIGVYLTNDREFVFTGEKAAKFLYWWRHADVYFAVITDEDDPPF